MEKSEDIAADLLQKQIKSRSLIDHNQFAIKGQ